MCHLVPSPGLEPGPPEKGLGVLATGPPGNPQAIVFKGGNDNAAEGIKQGQLAEPAPRDTEGPPPLPLP